MHKRIAFFVPMAGLPTLAAPSLAHHGRGGTYDMKRQVSLKGIVAEVLWRNPHIVLFVDAPDESGKGAHGTPKGLLAKIVFPDGREIFQRNAGVD